MDLVQQNFNKGVRNVRQQRYTLVFCIHQDITLPEKCHVYKATDIQKSSRLLQTMRHLNIPSVDLGGQPILQAWRAATVGHVSRIISGALPRRPCNSEKRRRKKSTDCGSNTGQPDTCSGDQDLQSGILPLNYRCYPMNILQFRDLYGRQISLYKLTITTHSLSD
jgi:hypothetical protein